MRLALVGLIAVPTGMVTSPSVAQASYATVYVADYRTESSDVAADAADAVAAYGLWQQAKQPVQYVEFVRLRDITADQLSEQLELDAQQLRRQWAEAPEQKQVAVLAALSQLGVRYRTNASSPGKGFDCSGLTMYAYNMAGISIPRVSSDQIRASERVDRDDAEPGDLMFYPGHIGMYVGADVLIHSPNTGANVRTGRVGRSYRYGSVL